MTTRRGLMAGMAGAVIGDQQRGGRKGAAQQLFDPGRAAGSPILEGSNMGAVTCGGVLHASHIG